MKVAILGAAHQHINYALHEVQHRPDLELVAASEPDPDLRERFLSGENLPLYETAEELLAAQDVDVALIAGVYSGRAATAASALRAGAHVLADKPLCITLDQLEVLREVASSVDRHVSIVFEKRFSPEILALRRLLAEGVLGTIAMVAATGPHELRRAMRPDWFLDPGQYGGIAADLPIHDIDLVLALAPPADGRVAGSVSALSGCADEVDHPGFDDHVTVMMRAGDVSATLEANWLAPGAADLPGHYRMRVTGSRGTAEVDWARHRLRVATHERVTWDEPLDAPQRPAQFFFDALREGRAPEVDTAASLLATEVALKAQLSALHDGARQTFGNGG